MADFIVLATADWDHPLWTNKQHTAVSLAVLGHRVLYVESLGLRPPRKGVADLPRILKRLRRVARPPRPVQRGIWVWSPLVLPGAAARRQPRKGDGEVVKGVVLRTSRPQTCQSRGHLSFMTAKRALFARPPHGQTLAARVHRAPPRAPAPSDGGEQEEPPPAGAGAGRTG